MAIKIGTLQGEFPKLKFEIDDTGCESISFTPRLPAVITLTGYRSRGVVAGGIGYSGETVAKDYTEAEEEVLTVSGVGGDSRAFGDGRVDP